MWLLETKSVPALREWAGLAADVEPALTELVTRVRKDKTLSRLYEEGTDLLYEKDAGGQYEDWRVWQPPVTEEAGLYLLAALAALPSVRVAHALRKVDESVTRATCRDIGGAVQRWRARTGATGVQLGIERELLPWFRLLASGELYRLGRLEFVRGEFPGEMIAWRERDSGKIVFFAEEGVRFDAAGYRTELDSPGGWQATLTVGNNAVIGNRISEDGLAMREEHRLRWDEWAPFLREGDPILEIHIPEGDTLNIDECRAALEAARAFFPRVYKSDPQPVAFICRSWLLDPAWQERLGDGSHITRFQKEGYLFPIESGRRDGLFYVFYDHHPDPRIAPRETRVQQFMLAALEKDEPLRSGGMMIPFMPA